MGDRANVACRVDEEIDAHIFLYTHYGGYRLPTDIRNGLIAARPRWTDAMYGCRILLSHIVGDQWASETGWGLGLTVSDNSYPVFEVDFVDQEVRLRPFDDDKWCIKWDAAYLGAWTFEEYVNLSDEELKWGVLHPSEFAESAE